MHTEAGVEGGKQENSILKNEKKNLLASEELIIIVYWQFFDLEEGP